MFSNYGALCSLYLGAHALRPLISSLAPPLVDVGEGLYGPPLREEVGPENLMGLAWFTPSPRRTALGVLYRRRRLDRAVVPFFLNLPQAAYPRSFVVFEGFFFLFS